MKGIGEGLGIAAILMLVDAPAWAQPAASARDYALEAQDLGAALRAFSAVSGREVIADAALIAGKRSTRIAGVYRAEDALDRLLQRTGLAVQLVDGGFVIRPGQTDQGNGSDIVVTGTRIRGAAPVGSPVIVIDRTAIERSGRGTIQSLVEALPGNFGGGLNESVAGTTSRNNAGDNAALGSSINLRGLGASSTLVLFDGTRPALGGVNGTFADISLIPQLAIDRVEILTDGSSALYGSDAVAGVVNFRFRRDVSGLESWARIGTADGDFTEHQLGQLAGARWTGGSATIAYQYSERGDLPGASRRYATDDLRSYGGGDFRSLFTTPGTIIAANGAVFGIPGGQDGRGLTAADLIPGQTSRRDVRKETDLLAKQRSHAVHAAINQDLTSWLSGYARLLYARREFSFDRAVAPESPTRVPVSNAFYVDPIGTGQPLTVRYNFKRDLGLERRVGSVDGVSGAAGLIAEAGAWRVDVSGTYGRQIEHQDALNIVNTVRLAAALADPDPATAYNLFGDGEDTNPTTIERVRGSRLTRTRATVWSGSIRADGPLFALPAGLVRLAIGGEHRREALSTVLTTDVRTAAPVRANLQGLPRSREIDAIYGELLVPLIGDGLALLPGTVDLSLAGRYERYSDFGSTSNPKLGLAWRPLAGVTLRGSYGRSFRAPGFGDLVGPAGNLYEPVLLADPRSPTGTSIALGLFGYADKIGPEKATSWTAGVDLSNRPISGLTASISYFDIAYRDRIASATADYLSFLTRRDIYGALVDEQPDPTTIARYFADPNFSNPLGVTPGQVNVIIDALLRNLSSTHVRGLDFDVALARSLGGGTAAIGIAGTRLFAIDRRITASSPAVDIAGTLGNPVRLRLRGRASWTKGAIDAGVFVNRVGSYANQTVTPEAKVQAWTTVDLSLGYRFAPAGPVRSARLALSALNLFDRDPPVVVNRSADSALGFDPEQASAVGRLVALQISLGW